MEDLNSKNRIEIRRHHNQLKITSNGVMILGAWSILKSFLMILSGNDPESAELLSSVFITIVTGIVFLILVAIDLKIRLVIWRGARDEAYGRRIKNRYIGMTIFLLFVSGLTLAALVISLFKGSEDKTTSLASLLVELTSFVIMCELLNSSFKIRKIRSELGKSEEGAD